MSWDDVIQCMACPNTSFTDREVYALHVKTEWHLYNTNCRMMGNPTLSQEAYLEKFGGGPAAVGGTQGADPQQPADVKQEEEERDRTDPPAEDLAVVVIIFSYQEQRWSHKFSVTKGTAVLDLKRSMVKPGSPEEDLVSFSLKKGMIRVWNFETIDSDETFEFQYCGPEEGQKLLDRDKQRKERDDAEAQARLEEEARKQEERKRQDEERKQLAEEKARHEEEQRRQQEELTKMAEEEKRKQKEEEEENRKREEEARKSAERQEEERRKLAEDEQQRAEAARQAEKASQEPIEITIHIDRALGFKTVLTVERGLRVGAIKERIAADDPFGDTRAEDFGLADSSAGRELDDAEQITQPIELDLKNRST